MLPVLDRWKQMVGCAGAQYGGTLSGQHGEDRIVSRTAGRSNRITLYVSDRCSKSSRRPEFAEVGWSLLLEDRDPPYHFS